MKNIFISIGVILIILLTGGVFLLGSSDTLPGMQNISVKNDATILALNESGRSSISGISALYLNPARLTTIKDNEIKIAYTKYFAEYNLFTVGYGHNFVKYGAIALSLSYFDSADLQLFNSNGTEYDVAKIKDYLINLGYSYKIINRYLSIGVTAKFLSTKIYNYSGTAYAADIGLYSDILMFPLSIIVENLGAASFDGTSVSLPQAVAAALAYTVKYQDNIFTINFDTKSYIEIGKLSDVTYLFGVVYNYNFINILGSYNLNTGEIGTGFGIKQGGIRINIGYAWRDVAPIYSAGLNYNFSGLSTGEDEEESGIVASENEGVSSMANDLSSVEIKKEIEQLKLEKVKVLQTEDFEKAAELKEKIKKLEEQLAIAKKREEKERLEKEKATTTGGVDKEKIKQQIEQLKAEKSEALKKEDFEKAAELKDKIKKLEEQMSKSGGGGVDKEKIKQQIEQLKAEKAEALKKEDFEKAAELKDKIKKLEEQMSKSGGSGVDKEKIKQQIEQLKVEKSEALKKEDFEKAAELKDKIKKLEEQLR